MTVHQGRTAVYRLYDKHGALIYVGISNNPHARWPQHATSKPWWEAVAMREIEWHATREDAERAEAHLISAFNPKWNSAPGMPPRQKSAPAVKRIGRGWIPPQSLFDLMSRYEAEQSAVARTRDEVEAELVAIMMTGVSASRLSKFLRWSTPVIQAIGKRGGVPPLRAPTVVSINKPYDDEDDEAAA